MPIPAEHIRASVDEYLDTHPDEAAMLAPVHRLLAAGADLTSRAEFRGHATAAAILADPAGRILQIRHLALGAWLLPGGHLEAADTRLADAALRELTEETGIPASAVTLAAGPRPLQIHVHPIPANAGRGEPAHQHADFRFLFRAVAGPDELRAVMRLQAEEVLGARWRPVRRIGDRTLRGRIRRALG